MSGSIEIGVSLDPGEAQRKIDEAEARSRASRAEAENLRRHSRDPRARTGGGSGETQGAIVGVLVAGMVATLVGEVVVEAVEEFLDDSGLGKILPAVARLRELAKRWGLPTP